MRAEQPAELSDAQIAALPNRAEEIVEALEPTPPAAPEPGTLAPGRPITPEEGSAIKRGFLKTQADLAIPIMADPGVDPIEELKGHHHIMRRQNSRQNLVMLKKWRSIHFQNKMKKKQL